jgi:hypothetical protein
MPDRSIVSFSSVCLLLETEAVYDRTGACRFRFTNTDGSVEPPRKQSPDMHSNELNKQREAAIWFRRHAGANGSLSRLGACLRCRLKSSGRDNTRPAHHFISWRRLICRDCPLPPSMAPPMGQDFQNPVCCSSLPTWSRRCCGTKMAGRLRQPVSSLQIKPAPNAHHRTTCLKFCMVLGSRLAGRKPASVSIPRRHWNRT